MNLLTIAISYKTPVIFLRESGYTLPLNLPDTTVTYVKIPDNAPFNPKQGTVSTLCLRLVFFWVVYIVTGRAKKSVELPLLGVA